MTDIQPTTADYAAHQAGAHRDDLEQLAQRVLDLEHRVNEIVANNIADQHGRSRTQSVSARDQLLFEVTRILLRAGLQSTEHADSDVTTAVCVSAIEYYRMHALLRQLGGC